MKARDYHFDSMRGIAACMVAITHFLAAFYPYSVFGPAKNVQRIYSWENAFLLPPLSFFTAGHFAVCLFFVLSGYVLSIKIIGEKKQLVRLIGAIVKRPIRLGGVLVFSLLCAGLLFQFNGFFHVHAAQLSQSGWFAQFWSIDFSWAALAKGIIMFRAGSEYNPPLWTLAIELKGSFLVFGLLLATNWLPYKYRTIALCICLIGLFNTYYAGFIWGMLLADATKHTQWLRLTAQTALIGFATALFLAAFPYYSFKALFDTADVSANWYQSLYVHVPMLSAVLLITMVISSNKIQNVLQRRFLLWLGDISYALYAMHLLLIGSLLAFLHIKGTALLSYGVSSLIILLIYIVLLLVISTLVTKFVDKPAVQLANRIDRFVRNLAERLINLTSSRARDR